MVYGEEAKTFGWLKMSKGMGFPGEQWIHSSFSTKCIKKEMGRKYGKSD